MIPDIKFVRNTFLKFNSLIFKNDLPVPRFSLVHASTFLGKCRYRWKRGIDGKIVNYDFNLRFSLSHDLDEFVWEDTVIHEMIHYHMAYHNIRDSSSHGPEFRKLMNSVNARFGRHMSVSHKSDPATDAQKEGLVGRWHAVAVLRFSNGNVGLKVLPRVVERIAGYHRSMSRLAGLSFIELFMSNDIYFERFPCSSVLKYHLVDAEAVEVALRKASRILCEDGKMRVIR